MAICMIRKIKWYSELSVNLATYSMGQKKVYIWFCINDYNAIVLHAFRFDKTIM